MTITEYQPNFLSDELSAEKDKYKVINNDLDATFAELTGF